MNGQVFYEYDHSKPETYSNVKVYAAGKNRPPTDAWIRNLQASTTSDSKVTFPAPPVTAEINVQTLPTITGGIDIVTLPSKGQKLPIVADKGVIDYPNLFKIKVDNQIGFFNEWGPTFEINFDLRINSFGSKTKGIGEILSCTSRDGHSIPLIYTSMFFTLVHQSFLIK